jgi:hypothetical protein
MRIVLAVLLVAAAGCVYAQDALRGKRLYLDAARLVGSAVSCVDCHGGLPGGAFGIGRAANSPALVERAVNSVPQMEAFRGRLAPADYVDLAAFIGAPGVPSPDLRFTITAPSGGSSASDRIDFGSVAAGTSSAIGTLQLVNVGQVPLQLTSAPRLRGADAVDFAIVATDCAVAALLQAQQSCRIDLAFRPMSGSGLRGAAVQVDHDWVEGAAALAVIGTATTVTGQPAPQHDSGGGGALDAGSLLWAGGIAAALYALGRRRDLRRRSD